MKSTKYKILSGLLLMLVIFSGCDLKLQTDAEYLGEALDPHVNVTAWTYIQNNPDLSDMMDAIEYTGMDTIFSQTKKKYTFLVVKNPALTTLANRLGYLTVKDMPKSSVVDLLKYHIIEGEYSGYHKPTPVVPVFIRNLLKGEDALITLKIAKSAWPTYDLSITTGNAVINAQGSNGISPSVGSSTCNILTTNGVMHIFQKIAYYQRDKNYNPLFVPKNY